MLAKTTARLVEPGAHRLILSLLLLLHQLLHLNLRMISLAAVLIHPLAHAVAVSRIPTVTGAMLARTTARVVALGVHHLTLSLLPLLHPHLKKTSNGLLLT